MAMVVMVMVMMTIRANEFLPLRGIIEIACSVLNKQTDGRI